MRDLDQLQLQQLADHLLDLDSGSGEGLLLKRIAARIEALEAVTCPSCGGEGRELHGHPNDPHPKDYGPCEKCHGEGRVGRDSV